jgi:hypothetical protein
MNFALLWDLLILSFRKRNEKTHGILVEDSRKIQETIDYVQRQLLTPCPQGYEAGWRKDGALGLSAPDTSSLFGRIGTREPVNFCYVRSEEGIGFLLKPCRKVF